MEEDKWLKGVVDDKKSDIFRVVDGITVVAPRQGKENLKQAAAASSQEEQKDEEVRGIIPINLGKRVFLRIMGPLRRQLQLEIDEKLKEELLSNYDDHLSIRQYNIDNQIVLPGFNFANEADQEKTLPIKRFFSVCNKKNSKPIWSAYSEPLNEAQTISLMSVIPTAFKHAVV